MSTAQSVSAHLIVGEDEARELGQLATEVRRDPRNVVVAEQEGRQALVAREVVQLLDLVVREVHRVELVLRNLWIHIFNERRKRNAARNGDAFVFCSRC